MTDPGLESRHTGRLAGHGIKNADAGLHSHPEIGLARISDEPRLRDGRETFLPRPPARPSTPLNVRLLNSARNGVRERLIPRQRDNLNKGG